MKSQQTFQNGAIFLSFLLSSPIIFNPLYKSENKPISSILTIIFGIILFVIVAALYSTKIQLKQNILFYVFNVTGFIVICLLASFNVLEFTRVVSVFSEFYSGQTYRLILGCLIILVSSYAISKNTNGIFRLCSLAVILFIAYYAFMYLGLFTITQTVYPPNLDYNISHNNVYDSIRNAFYLFADICVFLYINKKTSNNKKTEKYPLVRTALVYSGIILANMIRTCFTFGTKLSSHIENCDIASLKLIPTLDITEVIILVSGFAIVIKCSFYLYAAKIICGSLIPGNSNNRICFFSAPIFTLIFFILAEMFIKDKHIFSTTIFNVLTYILTIVLFLCILFSKKIKNTSA